MATYKFAVEHTGRPFGPTEKLRGWKTMSRHTSLSAARKRIDAELAETRRVAGSTAWNDHYRIVPLTDTQIRFTLTCHGYLNERAVLEGCFRLVRISLPWLKGEPMPDPPTPEGWYDATVCQKCYDAEQEAANRLSP